MSHPLVMALFQDAAGAAQAARALRTLGIPRERVSIVARRHDEEGVVADAAGASPGSEIEDSRPASRLSCTRPAALPDPKPKRGQVT